MNRWYRFRGATIVLMGIAMWFGRKFELNKMFTDNDYLNQVWAQVRPGTDDRVFFSNQPWI